MAVLGELEAWLSREDVEALNDAILDSGASKTYVTKKVKLANAVPGEGFVKVATGQPECVSEQGDLGPLRGAQKVDSFSRTLVSVMDVAEQIGSVEFKPDAAFVRSVNGGVTTKTKIASATPSRLCHFDMEALERYVNKVAGIAVTGGG